MQRQCHAMAWQWAWGFRLEADCTTAVWRKAAK
jgi:hypothetical protein